MIAAKRVFAFGLCGAQRERREMVPTISLIGSQRHRDQGVAISRGVTIALRTSPISTVTHVPG